MPLLNIFDVVTTSTAAWGTSLSEIMGKEKGVKKGSLPLQGTRFRNCVVKLIEYKMTVSQIRNLFGWGRGGYLG